MNQHYMSLAIEKATEGRDTDGGGAFGAVIVRDNEIVCTVHNLVKGKDDLTQHAELLAIQVSCQKIGKDNLKNCILYTSCEPCMMCLGACHWAKFKAIYYGASAADAQQHGFTYSESYFDMDSAARRSEFNMTQLLREEALKVWEKV